MSNLQFTAVIENTDEDNAVQCLRQLASGDLDISQLPGEVTWRSLSVAWNEAEPSELQIEPVTSVDFEFFDALYTLLLGAGVQFKTAKLFDSATGSYHAWELSIDPDEIEFEGQYILLLGELDDPEEIEALLQESVIQQQLTSETTLVIKGASAEVELLKEVEKRKLTIITEDEFWDCMQAF